MIIRFLSRQEYGRPQDDVGVIAGEERDKRTDAVPADAPLTKSEWAEWSVLVGHARGCFSRHEGEPRLPGRPDSWANEAGMTANTKQREWKLDLALGTRAAVPARRASGGPADLPASTAVEHGLDQHTED